MLGDTLRWATELDASGFASGAQRINSGLGEMGFRTSAATMNMGGLGTVIGSLANPMTLAAGAAMALGAAFVGSVQAAAAWQSSMSGVSKTTGLTGQDLGNLSKELLDMSTRMPAAASEIANVAQVAGSLGIAAQDISSFTEVAIQMGVGFEMSADQAATSGAKILTAFKLETTAENMQKLGSVVNAMGDSFAATEPQVLDFLNRASFLNTTMGQTIPQIAALGTVLISTGLDADVAATGLKSFLNMATSETSKKGGLDNWAALMNISVEELKANLEGDFNQTLIDTANAIAAIEDPVERFQAAVALAGTEGAPAILKLAGQQENLHKALGLTNDEWERAQSLQKTYAAQSETYNSQMQIFWNVVNMAGTELGTVFLPALTEGIGILADMTLGVIATGEAIYGVIEAWNEWVKLGVGKYAEMEKQYEEEHGGHWELIGGDAVWIGETVADAAAKEIEENERLQNSGAEAIQAGIDAGVFKKVGEEAGEETGDAMAESMAAAISRQSAGVSLAQAKYYEEGLAALSAAGIKGGLITGTSDSYEDMVVREFEYLGKKIQYIAKEEIGKYNMGDFYQYKFKVDDAIFDTGRLQNQHLTPSEAFELATGLPAPEDGTAAHYRLMGDEISAVRLELQEELRNSVEGVNLWDSVTSDAGLAKFETDNKEAFDKVSDIVETNLYRAARDIEQNGPVVADLLGSSMGLAAGQVDPATLDESLQNVLNALADPGSVDTAILETSLAHLMGASLISASDSEEIKAAAGVAAEGYMSALFGALESVGEKRSLAEVISGGLEGVEDVTAWIKNEYQPTLKTEMGEMNKIWDTGYSENREVVREYLEELKKDHEEHSEWFEDWQNEYIDLLESGALTEDQFLNVWDETANKMQENASAAIDDIKTTNAMFYGEFLSDNAQWQSYVNENGGYVGPTSLYGGYREALEEERRKAQEVNSYWGITTIGSIGNYEPIPQTVELDDEQARADLDALISDIETKVVKLHVSLDMDVSAQVDTLVPLIEDVVAGALAAM